MDSPQSLRNFIERNNLSAVKIFAGSENYIAAMVSNTGEAVYLLRSAGGNDGWEMLIPVTESSRVEQTLLDDLVAF